MAIVQELNETYFMERFKEMGRGDQYTYEALEALYNYYDSLSEDIGEDIKLDVIAICCDWHESTAQDIFDEYNLDPAEAIENVIDPEDMDEIKQAQHNFALSYLNDETTAIDCGDTILYIAF
jgi:hypothetical protein